MKMVVHEGQSMQTPLSQVKVSENPILVLPCGHALTMSNLDNHMSMSDFYEGCKDKTTNTITFVTTKPRPNNQVSVVDCPSCHVPIVGIRRYGRRINYTQVALCLKKFEMVETPALCKAETTFCKNQGIRDMIPLLLDSISGLVFNSTQEVIQKNLQAMWQLFSGASSSSGSSATSSQQDEKSTAKSRRGLGSVASDGSVFPNSDIGSLFLYDIPKEQEQIWLKLIAPALQALKAFREVHRQAVDTSIRRLFEASAAHLYNFKTKSKVDDSNSDQDVKRMMEDCARECGLPPDGHAGSSFVRSIQGQCDVLLVVLHAAMQVLEKISLKVYPDHPSVSGWSRYVEDLLQCSVALIRILRNAAAKGKYYRLEMHARISLLDIYLKGMQWLGHRPFDHRNVLRRLHREAAVQDLLVLFKRTLQEMQDGDQTNLRNERIRRTLLLEAGMETARKIALGELKYKPASEEGNSESFPPKQIGTHKAGRWQRCPNGHWYIKTPDWWASLQGSNCPDCDTPVSASMHQLE
ncbi:hypothetical protein BGZ68_010450 [Mortierella alpina]|nr:hypothetical protein BGZ68_010450 [Mortierella alpina]